MSVYIGFYYGDTSIINHTLYGGLGFRIEGSGYIAEDLFLVVQGLRV